MGSSILLPVLLLCLVVKSSDSTNITISNECNQNDTQCKSLNNFAVQLEQVSQHLELAPDTHQLNQSVHLRAAVSCTMRSSAQATIICASGSVTWWFDYLVHLTISNIKFVNCFGIEFVHAKEVKITDSAFTGRETASYLTYFFNSSAAIIRTHFHNITLMGANIIQSEFSNIYLSNCSFTDNLAVAIKVRAFSRLSADSVNFTNNTSSTGAAINGQQSTIILNYCRFLNNTSLLSGGGAVRVSKCYLVGYDLLYSGNLDTSLFGGGAITTIEAVLHLVNNTFTNNSVHHTGGALRLDKNSSAQIADSDFLNNTANYGAAMVLLGGSTAQLDDTNLKYNTALAGGPLFLEGQSSLTSNNSKIESNIGGILQGFNCKLTLINSNMIINNIGNIQLLKCDAHFSGKTVISGNTLPTEETFKRYNANTNITNSFTPHDQYSSGAVNTYNSQVELRGNLTISKNNMLGLRFFQSTASFYNTITIEQNKASKDQEDREEGGDQEDREEGGGIYAVYSILNYHGSVTIHNNTARAGGGIYSGSTVHNLFSDHLTISSNTARRGGGLYMGIHSTVNFFSQHAAMKFISNTAIAGGAVYVDDLTYFSVCDSEYSNLSHNETRQEHECFFQVPGYSDNVSSLMTFSNNSAETGKVLFGGLLDRCLLHDIFSENSLSFFKKVSLLTDDSMNTTINSEPMQICLCTPEGIDCSINSLKMEIFRGQSIFLNITSVDENYQSVKATIYAKLSAEGQEKSRLNKGQSLQDISDDCTTLQYNVFSSQDTERIQLNPQGPCEQEGISKYTLHLTFKQCPTGFQLSPSNSSCECHSALQPYTRTTCNISKKSIERHNEFWVGYDHTSNRSDIVVHPHCPYDYCYPQTAQVSVNLESHEGTDAQCVSNRSGTLCGGCKHGYSLVLGSSKCKMCSNTTIALMVPIALGGILLAALLLTLHLTVDLGTINGIIFYANLIYINQLILYPVGESANYSLVIIAWLNLEFGTETCFYNGMDIYWRTWLDTLFVIYVLSLVGIVLLLKYKVKSYYIAKLLLGANPVGVLATMLLLIYTKILRVIATILSYATVKYSDHTQHVWLADPTVSYLQGKHLPLFLLALTLSIYTILFTLIASTSQWTMASTNQVIIKILSKSKVKLLLNAYHSPYSKQRQYWTGVLLLSRVASVLIVSATAPTNHHNLNLLLHSILIYLLATMKQVSKQIYTNRKLDILETIQLSNVGLLTVASLFISNTATQATLSSVSAYLGSLMLLSTIVYHLYTTTRKCFTTTKVFKKKQPEKEPNAFETDYTIIQNTATKRDSSASTSMTTISTSTITVEI